MYDYLEQEKMTFRFMCALHIRGNPIKDREFTVVYKNESGEWVEVIVCPEQMWREGKGFLNGFGDWVGLYQYTMDAVGRTLGKMTTYNGCVLEVLDGLLRGVYKITC